MVAVKPALSRSFGNDSWLWAPAVADIQEPTLAEVTALAGFDMSCSLFREQEGLSAATEDITLPAALCETDNFTAKGSTTYAMADLSVRWRPQDAAGADGKLAWEAMDDLAIGVLLRRQAVTSGSTPAVGQFIDVIPAQLAVKVPGKTSTGTDGVYNFTVGVSVIGSPAWNVAIVAGA